MMLDPRKLSLRFNLNLIEETVTEKTYHIIEATNIGRIRNSDDNNYALITDLSTPFIDQLEKINLIIVSDRKELTPKEKEFLLGLKKPVLYTNLTKRETMSIVDSYLIRKQQKPLRQHGTLLSVFGEGVLLIGKSGIGKSELALELITKSHLFIGDDAIDTISYAGNVIGKAPKLSREFIEVRGVGIINIKGMFGIQSLLKETYIDLVIELVDLDEVRSSVDRLGKKYSTRELSGIDIPLIQVPVASGRSIAPIVEAAVIAFKQRKFDNYIAVNDLTERLKNK